MIVDTRGEAWYETTENSWNILPASGVKAVSHWSQQYALNYKKKTQTKKPPPNQPTKTNKKKPKTNKQNTKKPPPNPPSLQEKSVPSYYWYIPTEVWGVTVLQQQKSAF